MFKRARYLRWLALLISVVVEATAFWFGGPQGDPQAGLLANIITKMNSASAWTWVGWASLSMAWLWTELAFVFYSNGRRVRGLLSRNSHEELIYETGVHWLVLLRDIRLNQLNDGSKAKLEEELLSKNAKRSFAWHAVLWPMLLAIVTLVYFAGWVAWFVSTFPEKLVSLSTYLQSAIHQYTPDALGFLVGPLDSLALAAPLWLEEFYNMARNNTLPTFALLAGIWIAFLAAGRVFRNITILAPVLRFGGGLTLLAMMLALFATSWFDWLTNVYSLFPHHGVVAMGFFPLTLTSAFLFPHILFWSSWRYAIIRDTESQDATLITLGGVLNSLQQRINLQRIVDTDIFQLWWQRIVDVGDVELKEMGGAEPEKVRHVSGPHRLLDEIRNAIREGRKNSRSVSEFDE